MGAVADDADPINLMQRWLSGETVNARVGIRLRGGPFNGRIQIVRLDETGTPPKRLRDRSAPDAARNIWHVYTLTKAPENKAGWLFDYEGPETAD